MTPIDTSTALTGGVALLERATSYTLGSLSRIASAAMANPTPCSTWDLRTLLLHMNDSLLTLYEAVADHHVGPGPVDDVGGPAAELVASLRSRACRMLGAWTNADAAAVVSIVGCPLTTDIVAAAGAVEVAVHGWDVAAACGHPRRIPAELAAEMLDLLPLLVTDADRPARFAAPVDVPWHTAPGDRLVASLGRRPRAVALDAPVQGLL